VAWPFTCDDSAITFRFAEQAAAGNPLGTVAAGDPLVSGFSNPTWTGLLAAASRAGLPTTGSAKALGALCFVLTAVLATRLIGRLVDRASVAWVGCAVGASCTVAVWSVSGLENPLIGLLVTATALLLVQEEQDGRTGWRGLGSSAVVAVLVVSRPDAFTYLAAAGVARVLSTRRVTGGGLAAGAADLGRWLLAPIAVLGAWTAFSIHRFGHPLANTVYAKVQMTVGDRITQLTDLSAGPVAKVLGFGLVTAALLLVPLALLGGWPRRTAATSVTVLALGTLVLPLSEVDWMADFRFFSTGVPLLVVLAAVGLDVAARWNDARQHERDPGAGSPLLTPLRFGAALIVLWALFNAGLTVQRAGEDFAPQVTVASVRASTEPLAGAGERWGVRDPLVMTADAGATVDDLDLRILDLAGLVDPQISHLMDDPDARREYAFAERRPELVRAGRASWSWNQRWGLTPARMKRLGYLRLPGIDEPAYLRRDLVVRPAQGAAGGEVALDGLLVPAAATDGTITVRAWVTAPLGQRNDQIRIRLTRAGATDGARSAVTTTDLGSGLLGPDRWDEDEAVVQVAHLTPPAGRGDLVVQVDAVRPDGTANRLAEQRIATGADAVSAAADRLTASPGRGPDAVERLQQLDDLQAAAPAQADALDAARVQVRAAGLDQLRRRLARSLAADASAASMEASRRSIVSVRGRTAADGAWADLAQQFQERAASAAPERRYRLLVIAASADPSDPSIQADLLAARDDRPSDLTAARSS
jgi:hypothetical protein